MSLTAGTSLTAAAPSGEGERVDDPNENDVLCGRGGSINSHKGNEQFRDLVEKRKRVYLTARFKREKRLIAGSIVTEIRSMDPPGRFLARKGNKDAGYWYDIGDEKAAQKTSQALRENAPTIRAEIETEINEQRKEMQRNDNAAVPDQPHHSMASPAHAPVAGAVPGGGAHAHPPYPPPPAGHNPYYPQQYWDWYYHYYGYGTPAQAPPPGGAPMPAGAPPPAPPAGYPPAPAHWGAAAAAPPPPPQSYSVMKTSSQEDADRRMAIEIQRQEQQAAALQTRQHRREDAYASQKRSGYLHHASSSSLIMNNNKRHSPEPPVFTPPVVPPPMSQEEKDLKYAFALQEEEDLVGRQRLSIAGDSARRTSRANAYSQVHRAKLDTMSKAHEPTSSWSNWMGFSDHTGESKASKARMVQFKNKTNSQDSMLEPDPSTGSNNDITYAPMDGGSGTVHAPQPGEASGSMFSHVTHSIFDSMGSWDTSGVCGPESGSHSGRVRTRTTIVKQEPIATTAAISTLPEGRLSPQQHQEGQEVQLMDVRDESSMPPPAPRVEIDWPSRVGSCHSWIPDSLGATQLFSHRPPAVTNQPTPQQEAVMRQDSGISPVHSLEMDGSTNDHSIGGHSVGGGSLLGIFQDDEMVSMQRVLKEVPSWERSMERSMRSKSPLSLASGDDEDSMIRVRHHDSHHSMKQLQPIVDDSVMDWESHSHE